MKYLWLLTKELHFSPMLLDLLCVQACSAWDLRFLFRYIKEEILSSPVLAGSPSRGGDVAVYAFDINQPSWPTPFYSVLVSISVFMALSAVFRSINSPGNSLLSHSVLPVLFLPYGSFQLSISL